MLIYRHKKNRRLKEQFLQLQEARRSTEAGQAIRRAFVRTIQDKLKSPVSVLCINALRSPLLTLINTAELIIDSNGQIPHDEYMQLRNGVSRDAYHVATSTHQLILFSLYGDDIPSPKQDWIGLNELARTILSSYDLQPSLIDKNRKLAIEFRTTVPDDVMVNTSPLLYELLNCLLDNADKYATGGTVLMSCDADVDGTYAISVSNDGPVIPAADAERIFEPFVRLSADVVTGI